MIDAPIVRRFEENCKGSAQKPVAGHGVQRYAPGGRAVPMRISQRERLLIKKKNRERAGQSVLCVLQYFDFCADPGRMGLLFAGGTSTIEADRETNGCGGFLHFLWYCGAGCGMMEQGFWNNRRKKGGGRRRPLRCVASLQIDLRR